MMTKGDIVLIPFPYSDLSGSKLRPSVVLAEFVQDLLVCFITSQTQWQESTDIFLAPTLTNGLKLPSLVRCNKIATIQKTLVVGMLGQLEMSQIASLDQNLKLVLQLTSI